MTSIPPLISRWISQNYPKPSVNPEWLKACLGWIKEELNLADVQSQGDEIIKNVENQLLNSDLRDSMNEGSGFPPHIASMDNTFLSGRFLVQITSITEIGHSAFTLQNVHQTRTDRADLNGLAGENEDDDPEEGLIPKFPRSMLKFEVSDGTRYLRAIEFKRLPELELGVTPLGYKMIIKDVPIRRGIAFLEPSNVELKGYMTEELDVHRDAQFAEDIRRRLGRPGPEDSSETTSTSNGTVTQGTSLANSAREPLRDLDMDDAPSRLRSYTSSQGHEHEPLGRRRRIPGQHNRPTASTSQLPTSTHTSSPPHAITASARQPSRLSQEITKDDFSEFGDDTPLDDAFLRELDIVEQAATAEVNTQTADTSPHPTNSNDEVIVIDSDSDDKENVAPVTPRRVRRRIHPPEENVIVID